MVSVNISCKKFLTIKTYCLSHSTKLLMRAMKKEELKLYRRRHGGKWCKQDGGWVTDIIWRNIKCAALRKMDNWKETGSAGGAQYQLTCVDHKVLGVSGEKQRDRRWSGCGREYCFTTYWRSTENPTQCFRITLGGRCSASEAPTRWRQLCNCFPTPIQSRIPVVASVLLNQPTHRRQQAVKRENGCWFGHQLASAQ